MTRLSKASPPYNEILKLFFRSSCSRHIVFNLSQPEHSLLLPPDHPDNAPIDPYALE
jgi:hypothetical protein